MKLYAAHREAERCGGLFQCKSIAFIDYVRTHEIKNGMSVHWMDIDRAIEHNLETLAHSDKQGLSILRETYLLQLIAKEWRLLATQF